MRIKRVNFIIDKVLGTTLKETGIMKMYDNAELQDKFIKIHCKCFLEYSIPLTKKHLDCWKISLGDNNKHI